MMWFREGSAGRGYAPRDLLAGNGRTWAYGGELCGRKVGRLQMTVGISSAGEADRSNNGRILSQVDVATMHAIMSAASCVHRDPQCGRMVGWGRSHGVMSQSIPARQCAHPSEAVRTIERFTLFRESEICSSVSEVFSHR